jgi:hypothetical protein
MVYEETTVRLCWGALWILSLVHSYSPAPKLPSPPHCLHQLMLTQSQISILFDNFLATIRLNAYVYVISYPTVFTKPLVLFNQAFSHDREEYLLIFCRTGGFSENVKNHDWS